MVNGEYCQRRILSEGNIFNVIYGLRGIWSSGYSQLGIRKREIWLTGNILNEEYVNGDGEYGQQEKSPTGNIFNGEYGQWGYGQRGI